MCRDMLLFGLLIFCCATGAAQHTVVEYYELQKEYRDLAENDPVALPAVARSIKIAKLHGNLQHLFYAYEDAVFYSPDRSKKLQYADSCVLAAVRSQDENLISTAYLGRGSIYYFNYRKYGRALNEYLLASQHAEKSTDSYLKFKIKYNIGVVKSYLGFFDEAMLYFQDCLHFFTDNLQGDLHPNLRFNNTKGYLNTLHQMMICTRNLKQWSTVEKLLHKAQPYQDSLSFKHEQGYFLKENAILDYEKANYEKAVQRLLLAEPILKNRHEENHLLVLYFYLGNSYIKTGNNKEAFGYFKKVDSLFALNRTALPEVRKTYELLLKNNIFTIPAAERLNYTKQLLQADSILQSDFPSLSSRIYREYDTASLIAEKDRLLKADAYSRVLRIFLIAGGGALLIALLLMWVRQKKIGVRYRQLQQKLEHGDPVSSVKPVRSEGRKMIYPDKVVTDLLEKLEKFENTKVFTDPDFTLEKLAKRFDTNKNHLSYVLNEHRKTNFHNYIASLRIRYITNLLNTDRQYLKYTTDILADNCGIKHRQQFSKQFYKYNKIRPSHFIEQKKKELNMF